MLVLKWILSCMLHLLLLCFGSTWENSLRHTAHAYPKHYSCFSLSSLHVTGPGKRLWNCFDSVITVVFPLRNIPGRQGTVNPTWGTYIPLQLRFPPKHQVIKRNNLGEAIMLCKWKQMSKDVSSFMLRKEGKNPRHPRDHSLGKVIVTLGCQHWVRCLWSLFPS